jgi:RNA polymerase sigma factor (sigma-70 family)
VTVRSPSQPSAEDTPPLSLSERRDFAAVHRVYAAYVRALVRIDAPLRDADDLEQEIFLRIHGALPTCDVTRSLKPWIKTIAVRIVRDHLQRCSSRCEMLVDDLLVDRKAADRRSDSEELLGTQELLGELLDSLDERQREMIVRYVRDGEPIEEIAEDLKLSLMGGYSLLRLARAKLAAAVRRHQARERRVLGGRGAFLFPFGLDALPRFDLFAALALRARAWSMRAHSALGRALATVKAASVSVGISAGLVLVVGALAAPPPGPSAREEGMAPTIAGAVIAAPVAPMASNAPASTSSAAPLPAFSAKSAAGPSSGASKGNSLLLEQRSLKRIEALLKTDPAAALAALVQHKKAFPREDLRTEREGIEESARARAALGWQTHPGAAPP